MRTRVAALVGISALAVVTLSGQSGRGAPTDFTLLDLNGNRGMALTAPSGATVFRGGTASEASRAGGSYESDVRLETPLSVSQIAVHYAAQILAAKWREEGRQAVENLAAPRFSGTPASVPEPPAEPGADTERALLAWGLGAAEIARLAGVRD